MKLVWGMNLAETPANFHFCCKFCRILLSEKKIKKIYEAMTKIGGKKYAYHTVILIRCSHFRSSHELR